MSKNKNTDMIMDRKLEGLLHDEDRMHDTRKSEEHERQKRTIMSMFSANPYDIPPELIPDGYDYLWVRENLFDVPDPSNMAAMQNKGWSPVPADRHPEYSYQDFFGRLGHMKNYIYRKGSLLCERPKDLGDLERKIIADYNHRSMILPALQNDQIGVTENSAYISKTPV